MNMGPLVFTGYVALAWVLVLGPGMSFGEADPDVNTRDSYRYQLRSLSGWASDELRAPKGNFTVFFGDYQRGGRGSAAAYSPEEAQQNARTLCEQNSGTCERLYSVTVKNATDAGLNIYLYHPQETRTLTNNSLFTWMVRPDDKIRLSLKHGDRVFVTKSFLVHIVSRDGFAQWGPKKIEAFRSEEEHGPEGDNLAIRVSEGRLIGQKHASWSYGLTMETSDGRRKLFQAFLEKAVKGLPSAQFHVAAMYEEGKGCPKDLAQALRWYHRASLQDHVEAHQALKKLRNNLTCDWILGELRQMRKSEPSGLLQEEPLIELLGDPRHRCMTDGNWTWEWPCADTRGPKRCVGYVPDRHAITADLSPDAHEPDLGCKCSGKTERSTSPE